MVNVKGNALVPNFGWLVLGWLAGWLVNRTSRLYRRRMLQVNTRWKALDEIYKICMLLHSSGLNISANFHRIFWRFQK